MQEEILLEQIWSQIIRVPEPGRVSPLSSILESLLSVSVVTLIQDDSSAAPYAMTEDSILLPGVSFGDVLAEEFNITMPENALVLVEPAHLADAEKYDPKEIGEILGRILIGIACSKPNYSDTSEPAQSKFQKLVDDIRGQGANIQANGVETSHLNVLAYRN
jgi:hypothetical protein